MSEPTLGPTPMTEPALALSLSFEDGKALVTLRDHALTDGLIVRTLDLELSEVEFPLDLERGASEFQRRSTRMRGMVLDLKLDWLAGLLGEELEARAAPFKGLSFAAQGDQLFLQVQLQREGPGVPMLSRLLVAPLDGGERALGFALTERMVYGPAEVPPYVLPAFLEEAIRGVLGRLSEPVASTFQRVGAAGYSLDPVHALLWAVMPASGWKLPDHGDIQLTAAQLLDGGVLRVVAGEVPAELIPTGDSEREALAQQLSAEDQGVYEELAGVGRAADALDSSPEARQAGIQRLLPQAGDPVAEDWLRQLATGQPELIPEVAKITRARLQENPKHAPSLLFSAAAEWAAGRPEAARRGLEAAGRALRAQGARRAAGLALRVASELEGADRARLLEESIALAPDDPVALAGLVEVLPTVGRASGAIRAARRLSNISRDPRARAQAHVQAARLLRDAEQDLRGARRELDRAQRLLPGDPMVEQEYARCLSAEGKRAEAAERYEALVARAEAEGGDVAGLLLHSAELWLEEDPSRALSCYQRAHQAAPERLEPLMAYVDLARQGGIGAEAYWAVEAAAPLMAQTDAPTQRAMCLAAARLLAAAPDRREDAIAQYERAVEDPGVSAALLEELAACYAAREDAVARAQSLADIAPRLAAAEAVDAAVQRWSEAAEGLAEGDPLLTQMLSAVERAQAQAYAHRGLSDLRVALAERSGDPQQLSAAVDRRLVLDDPPEARAALFTKLGAALERASRARDAARAYEQAVGEHPQAQAAVDALVRLYRALGDNHRLAGALGYAAPLEAELIPRTEIYLEQAELLFGVGQVEEAYAVIEAALAERPGFDQARMLAARAAQRLGRGVEVVSQLEQCLQIEGLDSALELQALSELSQALERLGDRPVRLIEVLERARALAPEGPQRAELEARLAQQLEIAGQGAALARLNRERAEATQAKPSDRAGWLLQAARIEEQAEDLPQAEADAQAALSALGEHGRDGDLRAQIFGLLESLIRRREDPVAMAALLGQRATVAEDGGARERLRLDQAAALRSADQAEAALAVLQEAAAQLPSALSVRAALAALAAELGQAGVAADAYAASARLAKTQGERGRAIGFHAEASRAYGEAGAVPQARSHDRAILDLVGVEEWTEAAEQAARRLEADARDNDDHQLLSEVLRRRAEVASPEAAAQLWLDKAGIDRDALERPEDALKALSLARKQGAADRALVQRIDATYVELLHAVGRFDDEARVLCERAERLEPGAERAGLLLSAAKLYDERLEEPSRALLNVQASLRVDPDNAEARALRLQLLRDGGRPEALAEALTEEAPRAGDPATAAALWMEAAGVIAPQPGLDAEVQPRSPTLRRALSLVRRAAAAQPAWADPARAAVAYTRALARPEEELVALAELLQRAQLPEAAVPPAEAMAAELRRAELLDSTGSFSGAQAELSAVLDRVDGLSVEQEAEIWPLLGRSTQAFLRHEQRPGLLSGALAQCVRLAEQNEDWPEAVRFLDWCVSLEDEPERIAQLRVRAGKLLDDQVKDPSRAEAAFLAALAAQADQAEARACLRALYVRAGRFESLAQTLGTEVLREVWEERAEDSPERKLACVTALWPRMPEGEERSEAKLAAAELSEQLPQQAEQPAEKLLEEVSREGTGAQMDRALARLRPLYMRAQRFGPYCDVLRRQAERVEGDAAQAAAVAELGEALEDRVGDVKGAEAAYQRARGLDASCEAANRRFTALLATQDRFAEIQTEQGSDALLGVIHGLLGEGSAAETRAFSAVQVLVAAQSEPERAGTWLTVAEAALERAGTRGPAWELAMLRRGANCAGGAQLQVLDKLCERLRQKRAKTELVDALRQRAGLTEDPQESAPFRFELAERLLAIAEGLPNRTEAEQEAEAVLVALVAEAPEAEAPRARLAGLYEAQERWVDLGQTAGSGSLRRLRAQADEAGELDRAAAILTAHAELSEGEERAELLVDRVAYVPEDEVDAALELYRSALSAHAENARAREGLRELLESEGRYQELAGDLGMDTLRGTVHRLKHQEDSFGLLPATLALADVLEGDAELDAERRGLLVDAAALHDAEGDDEAAEWALRQVLEEDLSHAGAREAITALFVLQDRLQDLADLDPSMLETRAAQAAQAAQVEGADAVEGAEGADAAEDTGPADHAALAVAAWRVLAERDFEGRASQLWLKAARLDDAQGRLDEAEQAYRAALSKGEQPAELEAAQAGLTDLLWRQERFTELPELLGPEGLLAELNARAPEQPDEVVRAVELSQDSLPSAILAQAWELSASLILHDVDIDDEDARREDALAEARAIWDAEGDKQGQGRARIALARLTAREQPTPSWVDCLADAYAYARNPTERAELGEELVLSHLAIDQTELAARLCEQLIDAQGLPQDKLHQVAERFVESLSDPEDHERRERGLTILTSREDLPPARVAAYFVDLADTRDALGRDPEQIVKDLEAGLKAEPETDRQLVLHRRLYSLYDELGEWEGAERHATVIAEADQRSEQWVTVSELRAWMDDRSGARDALQEALRIDPKHAAAHESMIRLADQEGDADTAIQQLEGWAEADAEGAPIERADRLLRAAELCVDADDLDRAGALAARAVRQLPGEDPERFEVADRAEGMLAPYGLTELRVAVLQPVVGSAAPGERPELRLRLADLLTELDRLEEAATVVDGGLHREMSPDDPVLERLLADAEAAGPEAAARRLLGAAERLRSGAAARRLRVEGARYAEAGGAREDARTALSHLVSEVGAGEASVQAREALVRLTEELDDTPAHLQALVESAEHRETAAARAEGLIEAAEVAEQRLQDAERAEELLRRALELTPQAEPAREALIAFLTHQKRWMELQQELLGFTPAEGPERAAWCRRRASLAREQLNDPAGAAALLAEAFFADRDPERGAEAVDALAAAGRATEAERVIAEVEQLRRPPDPVWRRVQVVQVNLLEAAHRVDEAADRLDALVAAYPESCLFILRRIQLCLRHELEPRLFAALTGPMPKVPAPQRLAFRLTAVRRRREDREASLRMLREALVEYVEGARAPGMDPLGVVTDVARQRQQMPEAGLLELADLAGELGDATLAIEAMDALVAALPPGAERWRAQVERARVAQQAGQLDAAEQTLTEAQGEVQAAGGAAPAEQLAIGRAKAELLWAQGRRDDALAELVQLEALAVEAAPQVESAAGELRLSALAQRVKWLRQLGQDGAALEAARALRALQPERLSDGEWAAVVEAAGPSLTLARLREAQAQAAEGPEDRARLFRAAARVRTLLGEPEEALRLMCDAYQADPQQPALAELVGRGLYEAGRIVELEAHLTRRLEVEDLSEAERLRIGVERAQLLVWRLGRPADGLRLIQELNTQAGPSPERLELELSAATQAGELEQARVCLDRMAALSERPELRARALARRASLDVRMGEPEQAIEALSEALSLQLARRDWVERLAALHCGRGDRGAEAGVWLRYAGVAQGVELVCSLARGAALRLASEDRRGALAAFEAAARAAPEQLSLRWALVDLNRNMGDPAKAGRHAALAEEVATARGLAQAARAAVIAQQELAALAGDPEAELQAWSKLGQDGLQPAWLRLLVERTQAGLPAAPIVGQLEALSKRMAAGPERAVVRAARADILEVVLVDRAAAETARAAIEAEDGGLPAAPELRPVLPDEELQSARAALEEAGDARGMAELLHRLAQTLEHPAARARTLVEAAQALAPVEDGAEAALSLLREACDEHGLSLPAWQARLRLELQLGLLTEAQASVERLEQLGGGAFAPAELELMAAGCYQASGDPEGAAHWLARAKAQDPASGEVVARMAALAESLGDDQVAVAWLQQQAERLDPVVELEDWLGLQLRLARRIEAAGDDARLGAVLDQILDRRPADPEVWGWQLKRLRAAGEPVFLLDALGRAAELGLPGAALEAITLAGSLGLVERRRGLAARLRSDDSEAARAALLEAYTADRDGAGLLRLADNEAALDALPVEARAWVTGALLRQGRAAEAWRLVGRAEDPAGSLRAGAPVASRAAAWCVGAAALGQPTEPDPALSRGLAAGIEVFGERAELVSALLACPREPEATPSRASLLRAGLRKRPLDPEQLSALAELEPPQRGARAVHRLLVAEQTTAPLPKLVADLQAHVDSLRLADAQSPLGQLLRLSALALAPQLPRPEEPRLPGQDDPRLQGALEGFASLAQAQVEVWVAPDGGARAWIEAGAPPRVVLGEALVDDATPEELRFHLIRGLTMIQEGYLLVTALPAEDRADHLRLVASLAQPQLAEGLPEALTQARDALLQRLGSETREAVEALADPLGEVDRLQLGPWASAVARTADRVGILGAGELSGALKGLLREEPRLWVRRSGAAARRAAVARGWPRLSELLAWLVHGEAEAPLSALAAQEAAGRF